MLRRLWRRPLFLVTIAFVSGISTLFWLKDESSHHDKRIHQLKSQERVILSNPNTDVLKGDNSIHTITHMKKIPKVYIYDLPPKFNMDIKNCISPRISDHISCFNFSNNGFGDFLYEKGDMRVHNTNQFSLEVVMHHQLANSRYRTYDPKEADVFYIPSYIGVMFFCKRLSANVSSLTTELFEMLDTWPYFKQGKPHFAALAKIEREQSSTRYPYLKNPHCQNVTYLAIEKEAMISWRSQIGLQKQRIIVVPYPSYVHRNTLYTSSQAINSPGVDERKVFLFLASSTRRSNFFRAILIDQFQTKITGTSKAKYLETATTLPEQLMLVTTECSKTHLNITVEWMENSVFCLQPQGDSPTRKSFYDSIQSGCIPVIFKFGHQDVVYPFQSVLNYTDFTVSVESHHIQNDRENILDILKKIPKTEIRRLQKNLVLVARQFQYSVPDMVPIANKKKEHFVDAVDMIMYEISKIYNLK
ncbi:uncharacterized protein [Haliotis cracherodii]|uniref:uncharacterized protein n=1 Tax=Haliotis cracherodii TaxID=6455 RepID=UPI0039E8784E